MVEIIQPSFAKGEISPSLFGRVDTAAYGLGLATARNTIIHTYGGISRRPGSRFIAPVKDHSYAPILVEFQFKTTDTYILEFGDQYMRVIRNDGNIVVDGIAITGATQANPVVVTAVGHAFSDGDEVFFANVEGMVELNGNRYIVANSTANTFELTDQVTGANVDGTNFTAFSVTGEVAKIYEIATPYSQADLRELSFVQSADVMTIASKSYPIYELSRFDNDDWQLEEATFGPTVGFPTDIVAVANTAGGAVYEYKVTAIDRETEEESLSGLDDREEIIASITQANPVVVTISGTHGYANGDEIQLDNITGMTELNGNRYFISNRTSNTFELQDEDGTNIDSTSFTAYVSGGISRPAFYRLSGANSTVVNNSLTWTAVPGASVYAVYRLNSGSFGLIGETTTTEFDDDDINPDTSVTPPGGRNPFRNVEDYPGAVGYYEQRRVFGGSTDKPDTNEFSQTANQSNFNRSRPTQADDSITAGFFSQQVNEIRHYVGQNDLLVFTSGGEWRVNAGPDQIFGPETITLKPQSNWGCSTLPPIVAGNAIIYITENDANVRSLGYSLELDGYTGADLNILSQHLLSNNRIVDWCYTKYPEGRFYMVRDDGQMLTLSFNQEQEIVAWTRWDTDGQYEACAALRAGGLQREDSLYTVVRRRVNGNIVRYIEVLRQQQDIADVRDAFFVDSGLTLDNPIPITNITSTNPVVVTATDHGFVNGDPVDFSNIVWTTTQDANFNDVVPDQLNLRRYTVANATTNTFEIVDEMGAAIDGSAFQGYIEGGYARKAVSTIRGLDHLEGREIVLLADGNVLSNFVVTGGKIDLPRAFSRIHAGLLSICDIETLNIEIPDGTVQPYRKNVASVYLKFYQSRGLFVGPNKDNLDEMKFREFEKYGDPTDLFSGDKKQVIQGDWNENGRVFMRQPYPLPLTLLSVTPSFDAGDI